MENTLSNEQKEEIINKVINYLNEYEVTCAEAVPQDDEMQIGAIELAGDLADIALFEFEL